MTECPLNLLGDFVSAAGETMMMFEAFDVLDICDMWKDGHPPNTGGSLDQPNRLRLLAQFVWAEQAKSEAEILQKLKR